jgi:energy-coupling factor transporter transmembrane protein EcfT
MSLLGHGLLLLVVLAIAHIPTLVVSLIVPSLPVLIVLFFVEAFINGFVAKNIAGLFEEEY